MGCGFIAVKLFENQKREMGEAYEHFRAVRLDVFGSALRDAFRPGQRGIDLLRILESCGASGAVIQAPCLLVNPSLRLERSSANLFWVL